MQAGWLTNAVDVTTPIVLGASHRAFDRASSYVCNMIALYYIGTLKTLPCDDLVRFPNERLRYVRHRITDP